MTPNPGPGDGKVIAFLKAAAPVLVALVTAAGGYATAWVRYGKADQPTPPVPGVATTAPTTTASTAGSAVRITITPPDGPVPRCAIVHGTATMPNGEPVPKHLTVWAAQHVSGESEYFDLTKVTKDANHPERWHVQFTLGDPGQISKEFVVYAFALGAEATELLERIETAADPEDAYSYFFLKGSLPVQDGVKGERFQRNDHDTKPCQ